MNKNAQNFLEICIMIIVSIGSYFLYEASGWELIFLTDTYDVKMYSYTLKIFGYGENSFFGFNNKFFDVAQFGIINSDGSFYLAMSNKYISSWVILKYLACILPIYTIVGAYRAFVLLFYFDFSGKNNTYEKNQAHEENEKKQKNKERSGTKKEGSQQGFDKSTNTNDDLIKNEKKFIIPNDHLDKKKTDQIDNKISTQYVNAANQVVILMPNLGFEMEEGLLSKWLVKEGDSVSSGDLIAEVETDFFNIEIPTYYDGIIGKILIKEGQENIKVNEPIAILLLEDKTWHRDFLILHRNGLYVVKEKSFKSLENAKTYIDTFLNEL